MSFVTTDFVSYKNAENVQEAVWFATTDDNPPERNKNVSYQINEKINNFFFCVNYGSKQEQYTIKQMEITNKKSKRKNKA